MVLVVTGTVKNGEATDLGLGTGVIVDPAGYVLTNWHSIAGYCNALFFLKPALGAEPLGANAYGDGTAVRPALPLDKDIHETQDELSRMNT